MSAVTGTVLSACRAIATYNLTLSGTQIVDGISLNVGDRVLAVGQTAQAANGVYVVASGAWARSTDFATSGQMVAGVTVPVYLGALNAATKWLFVIGVTVVVGTTALVFVKIADAIDYESGASVPPNGVGPFPDPGDVAQDHDAQAQSLVALQYKKSPNLLATIALHDSGFQIHENVLTQIPELDDPNVATGNPTDPIGTPGPLDVTGELVGQSRVLSSGTIVNDATFRTYIAMRISRNSSIGSAPQYIHALTLIFGATPFRFLWFGGLSAGVEVQSGAAPSADIVALLDDGPVPRAAAVGVGRVWYGTTWFGFDEDVRSGVRGFGEIGNPSVGAPFGELF